MNRMLVFITHTKDSFLANLYPRRTEWLCAAVLFFSGIVMMADPELMANNPEPYRVMLTVMDQSHWARVLVLLGVLRWTVLFINGFWRRSPHCRALASVFSCLPLFSMASSFTSAFDLAMVFSWVIVAAEFSNVIAAAKDAKESDVRHGYGSWGG